MPSRWNLKMFSRTIWESWGSRSLLKRREGQSLTTRKIDASKFAFYLSKRFVRYDQADGWFFFFFDFEIRKFSLRKISVCYGVPTTTSDWHRALINIRMFYSWSFLHSWLIVYNILAAIDFVYSKNSSVSLFDSWIHFPQFCYTLCVF